MSETASLELFFLCKVSKHLDQNKDCSFAGLTREVRYFGQIFVESPVTQLAILFGREVSYREAAHYGN